MCLILLNSYSYMQEKLAEIAINFLELVAGSIDGEQKIYLEW